MFESQNGEMKIQQHYRVFYSKPSITNFFLFVNAIFSFNTLFLINVLQINYIAMLLKKALNVSLARQSSSIRFDPLLEVRCDNSRLWLLPPGVAPATQRPM